LSKFLVRKGPARAGAELGQTGLRQYGGTVVEEWLRQLDGERGRRIYREMADNDPTMGAILFSVEMLLRNVDWRVEPFSQDPAHVEQQAFVESLMTDMDHTWEDLISEVLSMLVFGFAINEIVYKARDDGKIGWKKLAPRAQDTVERWVFDPPEGGDLITGFWQQVPSSGHRAFIPVEKMLLFKTTSRKSNPEGRSVLRNAFLPWYRKRRIEEIEAIGVERDLVGLPVFYLPKELFDDDAPAAVKAQLADYQRAMEELKNDEQAGVLMPSIYDANNNKLASFELLSTAGRRLFDTVAIANRYDQAIARSVLADFLFLGSQKVGSFALSSDKTEMYSLALGAWLKEIAAVLNRQGLPRLYELNGWDSTECAKFMPGDIEKSEVIEFANAVTQLTGAGWLTPGSEVDEAAIRDRLDLPERQDGEIGGPPQPQPAVPEVTNPGEPPTAADIAPKK
jgi:hypothetical protein